MEWGILIVVGLLLFTAYVIVQETRAQMHWRGLVEGGDVEAIKTLLEDEIEDWHNAARPRARRRCSGTASRPWSCSTSTRRRRTSAATPMASTRSCRPPRRDQQPAGGGHEDHEEAGGDAALRRAQREARPRPDRRIHFVPGRQRHRRAALHPQHAASCARPCEHIDWEETEAADFVDLNEGRFSTQFGALHQVEPFVWPDETSRPVVRYANGTESEEDEHRPVDPSRGGAGGGQPPAGGV